jgi:hypothetical protein
VVDESFDGGDLLAVAHFLELAKQRVDLPNKSAAVCAFALVKDLLYSRTRRLAFVKAKERGRKVDVRMT